MIKGTWKKAMIVGLAGLLAVSMLNAAPKRKSKKSNENRFKIEKKEMEKNPKTKKAYDFKGLSVVIADWWSDPNSKAVSVAQEDERAYRQAVQDAYDFTMVQKSIGGWGTHAQSVANFCTTGGDENYIFVIDGRSVGPGLKANLFYDLSKITDIDWTNEKWNNAVREQLTKGNSFYGMSAVAPEPRGGLFFNKRLLQEANIDPDSIYDMQANGTWTWDAFEDMCKKLTRDIDNDGITDVYAMSSLSTEFTPLALDSNNGGFIGRDSNGKLYNNTNSEESLEALNWTRHMVEFYEKPSEEGANWDYMYTYFANGEVAFLADQEYNAQAGGRFHDMKDDYGFVCFPQGPKGKGLRTLHDDNRFVIPGCYDDERAQAIAKAYDLWSNPTPGYEGDAWKESYYPMFRDSRAVDETLAIMRSNPNPRYDNIITGFQAGDFIFHFWGGWATVQEQYEKTKNQWQALIDDMNR